MDVRLILLLLYKLLPALAFAESPPVFTLGGPKSKVTLDCDISEKREVSWYHQNSADELNLLVLAERSRTRQSLPFSFNKNETRFVLTTNKEITVAYLTITEVDTEDEGLYFCGTKADWGHMLFSRATRLQIKDTEDSSLTQAEEDDSTGGIDLEKVMMLVGVGAVALVFFIASVAAGMVIHKQAWKRGWEAAIQSTYRLSMKRSERGSRFASK
ncbi:uncharacterized protein [Hoplias malabaricus]|uniref:uncharacterized protein n=1 Tax=Hoplias malabaricus TaxID=27720 RepID=UPI003462834F